MSWNAALEPASQTGANGDNTATQYDGAGRPSQVTSPFGSNTIYSYTTTSLPVNTKVFESNKVSTTYYDGLGRPFRQESGDTNGVQSVIDTVYDACGCTPMGKPWKVSMPHAPTATAVWKVSTYDALGRLLTAVSPDGASTTTYVYAGNLVTVTDPAGKWKKYTTDAYGRMTQVQEQSPNTSIEPGSCHAVQLRRI